MDIPLYRGDSVVIPFVFKKNGVVQSLSGYAITFSVKLNINDVTYLFQKTIGTGVMVTDSPNGAFTVTILATDTKDIVMNGRLLVLPWDVELSLDSANVHSSVGTLTLTSDVTRS
jgi:hypothetical protein